MISKIKKMKDGSITWMDVYYSNELHSLWTYLFRMSKKKLDKKQGARMQWMLKKIELAMTKAERSEKIMASNQIVIERQKAILRQKEEAIDYLKKRIEKEHQLEEQINKDPDFGNIPNN